MTDYQEKAWNCLAGQDGETVLRLLTDYHGMQLLDEGFLEHLVDEGYLEEEEEERPEDCDYVISDCGCLGAGTRVTVLNSYWADDCRVKDFVSEEEAVKAIKEDMSEQNYWPNVWREDDHGGITLYAINN
jgi:hypothetical protein